MAALSSPRLPKILVTLPSPNRRPGQPVVPEFSESKSIFIGHAFEKSSTSQGHLDVMPFVSSATRKALRRPWPWLKSLYTKQRIFCVRENRTGLQWRGRVTYAVLLLGKFLGDCYLLQEWAGIFWKLCEAFFGNYVLNCDGCTEEYWKILRCN